jgi:hypothetical protein
MRLSTHPEDAVFAIVDDVTLWGANGADRLALLCPNVVDGPPCYEFLGCELVNLSLVILVRRDFDLPFELGQLHCLHQGGARCILNGHLVGDSSLIDIQSQWKVGHSGC